MSEPIHVVAAAAVEAALHIDPAVHGDLDDLGRWLTVAANLQPGPTVAEAVAAVRRHYLDGDGSTLTPELWLDALRAGRRGRPEPDPPRSPADDAQARRWLAGMLDQPCPACEAPAGTPCFNPITGRPYARGGCHPQRARAAIP